MAPKRLSSSDILSLVSQNVPVVFDQVQISTANHRKNCVTLHKIHVQAASVTESSRGRGGDAVKLMGERAFSDAFLDMLNRILVVKKGPTVAERVIKFVGVYVKFIMEKEAEQVQKRRSEALSVLRSVEDDDTPTSRFVSRLISYLLRGFCAKDKTIRLRSVGIVAELLSHLGELDEDAYSSLRSNLMERTLDKESPIRAHAVMALSKLLSGEDPEDLQDDESTILDTLLNSLCYDPAPEVRRIALLSTPLLPETLSTLLTRTRDIDVAVRTMLYAHTLVPSDTTTSASTSGASRHAAANPNCLNNPRQLSIEQREKVVRDGLGDREGKVRAGAGKMLAGWYDWASETLPDNGEDSIVASLVTFLKLFDVVSEGGDLVAVDALKSVFVTRPEVLDALVFQDDYWRKMTPESALLARAFIEYCEFAPSQESRLEVAAVPVVTAFAFYVQQSCNFIFDSMEALEEARLLDGEESEKIEVELADRVFILSEVLKVAAKLDYSDEIGRRKVFQVVRDMLGHELFPETLMDVCLDVLKETTPSEREIIRIVVEIINELRDSVGDADDPNQSRQVDDSLDTSQSRDTSQSKSLDGSRIFQRQKQPDDMTPEERAQADAIDARCLALCISTLKRVNGSFDENSTLEGVLTDLIVPAVKRHEMVLRERGLVSLGLCCLLAKNIAMPSFQLFLNQVQSAHEDLKLKVLQVIFDILIVYEEDLLRRNKDIADRIITFLLQTLEVEESHAVQALLCIGISKLMINGLITDPRVLTSLVLAYVSPITSDNQELRQCLAYFLPVYCYSLPSNQSRMRTIFLTAYDLVSKVYEELEADQDMITPLQFGNLFVDWTNPLKAAPSDIVGQVGNDVHIDLAIDILKALHDKERSDNDIKVFCQLLVKLYIPGKPEPLGLLCLGTMLEHLHEGIEDPATAKILARFRSQFKKQSGREFERLKNDVWKYARAEQYIEVCEIVGIGVPDVDEAVSDDGETNKGAEEPLMSGEEESEGPGSSVPGRNILRGGYLARRRGDEEGSYEEGGSVQSRSESGSRSLTPSPSRKRRGSLTTPPRWSPVTPRRQRQSKRIRSPIKSPRMASPAHKRVNNIQSPRKPRSRLAEPIDPFVDSTNSAASQYEQESEPASSSEEALKLPVESSSGEEIEAEPMRRKDRGPFRAQPKRIDGRNASGQKTSVRRSAAPAPEFVSSSEP